MSLSPTRPTQVSLILLLRLLLGGGFLSTSLLSYHASRESIRDNIVNTELPPTSDTVYSENQRDLMRPVLIASMMARGTFLRDWVLAGEEALRGFASQLRDRLRQADILCRRGGEEFVLPLKDTDHHSAFERAEKLRRYSVAGEHLQISASLGLSQWPPGEALHSLLARADRAKQGGRNRVCAETRDDTP